MQGSSLLTLLESARNVTRPAALTSVSLLTPLTVKSYASRTTQIKVRIQNTLVTTRLVSSTRISRNHLKDVKEYTAANTISIWQSTSNNPYENLAIEHYLLKNSDPASKILFTYVNWPCVVIGRNQNPWLECNLQRMQEGLPYHTLRDDEEKGNEQEQQQAKGTRTSEEHIPLPLVRRRSGGGTVIHDAGNLNFSFILPNDKDFTRDKHAELVVSMLRRLRSDKRMRPYYSSVRVNERHDIVMKQDAIVGADTQKEFKVSGSAYKLTRGRALHHGTILHSSPNILKQTDISPGEPSVFSQVLSSPAKPYLEAKGVSSVRSPVHNLFIAESPSDRSRYNRELQTELQNTFREANSINETEVQEVGALDCTEGSNKQIFDDIQELLTKEWQFCQTPVFEYSSSKTNDVCVQFQVKHGVVSKPTAKDYNGEVTKHYKSLAKLEGRKLHEISDWSEYIPSNSESSTSMMSHLATVFPSIDLTPHAQRRSVGRGEVKTLEAQEIHQSGLIKKRSTDGSVEVERQGENLVIEQ